MSQEANDERHLRNYLLGELEEAEQQTLEERLMAGGELFDLLHVAEDELIEDYVDGTLSRDERSRFDGYFLSTPDRRRKLSFAMALRRYVTADAATKAPAAEASPVTRPRPSYDISQRWLWWDRALSSPYFRMAAAAVIVLGIGLGVWRVVFYQSEVAKGLAALSLAYPDERPTRARISGFNYARYPNTRGTEEGKVDTTSRNLAEITLLNEVATNPSPDAHHALGRVYLAKREYTLAIEQFELALKDDSESPRLHSDLGTALLEKGKVDRLTGESGKSFEEFAQSLEHFGKALELQPSLLEALFNRALLFEQMSLPHQAEDDWNRYIERDPNSRWADEVRRHLVDLEERKRTKLQGRGELLPEFLEAYQSRNEDKAYELISKNTEAITGQLLWWRLSAGYLKASADSNLAEARLLLNALVFAGRLQEEKMGDHFVYDLAAFYETATEDRLRSIGEAHGLIDQAHSLLARSETRPAAVLYEKASALFDRVGDRMEGRFSRYWTGYCHYRLSQFSKSLAVLSQVAESSRASGYLWLLEQAVTTIANIQGESNRFSESLASLNESLIVSTKINDEYNSQKNLTALAYGYKNLGDRKESLSHMQRCLEKANKHWSGPRQMYRNFDTAAGILSSFDYNVAAAEYGKAALQFALEARDPGFEHLSYMHLAAISAKLQRTTEALEFADRSYQIAKLIADERASRRPIGHSSLQLAHIYRQKQEYGQAVKYYDDAIGIYSEIDLYAFLYEAHKGRLLCYIAQGNDTLAETEMREVLAFFEQHRSKIREEKNRNSFFDLEQYVYDIAIDFEYSKKSDKRKAFDYSEMSRARSLLDMMSAAGEVNIDDSSHAVISSISEPLTLDKIQERIPDETQILQYSVLDDKLLIWVVLKGKFEATEKDISLDSLTEKVISYGESISRLDESGPKECRDKAIELYELLIEPVESLLEQGKQICVVPDKILNCLPFNALFSPKNGRYLISDYVLSFAPSANTFLRCSEAARERSGERDERVLSVGGPLFDRAAYPDLSDLSSSDKEAEQVSACYGSQCCLVAEKATIAKVRDEMGRADIIHLASHYVVDENNPMLSRLLLTADPRSDSNHRPSDSVLRASEICRKKLSVTRLVVLSACRTGVERYYRGEGMIGMSRTFLAARVPLVVASLWPVASDPTAGLMISFHQYRKHFGLTSAGALRQAQLDMINDPSHSLDLPYYWASFVAIGGYASF